MEPINFEPSGDNSPIPLSQDGSNRELSEKPVRRRKSRNKQETNMAAAPVEVSASFSPNQESNQPLSQPTRSPETESPEPKGEFLPPPSVIIAPSSSSATQSSFQQSSYGHYSQNSSQNSHGGHERRRQGRDHGREQNRDGGREQNRDHRQGNNRYDNRKSRSGQGRGHNHGSHRFRDRPEMYDEEEEGGFTIELDMSDERIIRIAELQRMSVDQLLHFAKKVNVELSSSSLTKSQIVFEIVRSLSMSPDEIIVGEGTLEVLPDGYGFLRSPIYNYLPSVEDIYVSPLQVRKLELRKGDSIIGTIRSPKEKEKYFALAKVESVNEVSPSKIKERTLFENLTPLYPTERLVMETDKSNFTGRVIDLASPIGKGQRGIIVAPPRTGKTIILQQVAAAITANDPAAKLIVLLIDERPEEVTDMLRTVKGEVVASTFDEPPERHVQVAEMVIEKARRLVEFGHDVIILLDSLTRLARAYNTVQPHSGKILSGGIDANALHKPKRFFGAARNVEEGGSLTIIATALIETGSRMDEVIFEEFKGTGNMEVVLDRRLADRRAWPAIDILRSGTRKEDLLYHPSELEKIYLFRQAIADLSALDAMNLLLGRLKKTNSNVEFLLALKE